MTWGVQTVRYIDVLLYPTGEAFHPIEEAIRSSPALEPRAIHQFVAHDDGTVVMMYELEGDLEAAKEIFETQPQVISHDLTLSGSKILAYTHFRSADTAVGHLFEFVNNNDVLVDLPLRYEPNDEGVSALRVRIIGNGRAIQCAARNVPEGVYAEVVDTGNYFRTFEGLYDALTERQREVLDAAVKLGYFDMPRDATLEDVADEVGLARTTVGEHLRKISARVFTQAGRGL